MTFKLVTVTNNDQNAVYYHVLYTVSPTKLIPSWHYLNITRHTDSHKEQNLKGTKYKILIKRQNLTK